MSVQFGHVIKAVARALSKFSALAFGILAAISLWKYSDCVFHTGYDGIATAKFHALSVKFVVISAASATLHSLIRVE